HILGPVLKRMFEELGKRKANVRPCLDPKIGGIANALDWDTLATIVDMYPLFHLFLLIVERDGNEHRRAAFDRLVELSQGVLIGKRKLLAENAWQEVEVWALAG